MAKPDEFPFEIELLSTVLRGGGSGVNYDTPVSSPAPTARNLMRPKLRRSGIARTMSSLRSLMADAREGVCAPQCARWRLAAAAWAAGGKPWLSSTEACCDRDILCAVLNSLFNPCSICG